MGFQDHMGKLIMVESEGEIYEGILVDYDDDEFCLEIDDKFKFFYTAECEITLSDELIVPDHAAFIAKMAEMRRKGFYIIDGGNTRQ